MTKFLIQLVWGRVLASVFLKIMFYCATRVDNHHLDGAALPGLAKELRRAKFSATWAPVTSMTNPDHHPASHPDLWLLVMPPQLGVGLHFLGVYNSSCPLIDHQPQASFSGYTYGFLWVRPI